jgi:hypothetical protein
LALPINGAQWQELSCHFPRPSRCPELTEQRVEFYSSPSKNISIIPSLSNAEIGLDEAKRNPVNAAAQTLPHSAALHGVNPTFMTASFFSAY